MTARLTRVASFLPAFLLILGILASARPVGAQVQEPAASETQGPYATIQAAFLREDFARVVQLVDQLKPLDSSASMTSQTVHISLWDALSLERLQRTNEALHELDRLEARLAALPDASAPPDLRRLWPEVWFWDGEISRRAFQILRARRAYQRLLTDFPTSTWRAQAQLGLGLVLFHQQAYEAAREQVREVARGTPALPITREALLLEGLCLVKLKEFSDATTLFQRLLSEPLDPVLRAQATLYLGESLAGLERFDEAIAADQSVITMDPDSSWARFARFGIGWAYFSQHRYHESMEAFGRYVKSLPPSARREADLPWAGSTDTPAASTRAADQRRADVSGDAYAELWLAQGRCLLELGNESAAFAHFEALRRYAPNHPLAVDAALSQAELLQRREQLAEAKALLSSLLGKPLTTAQALPIHLRLGLLALALGDVAEAVAQFTAVSRADTPELRQAADNGLGDAQMLRGASQEAREWYERSVAIDQRSPGGLYATYQLGRLMVQDGHVEAAIEQFRFVTVHADDVLANDARLALALSYLVSDEPDLARTELERLKSRQPTASQVARAGYYLAMLAVRDGDAARAARLCEEVIRQAPRSDEAFEATLLLADVTAAQGSVQEALQVLRTSPGSMSDLLPRRRGVVEQKMAGFAHQLGDYAQAVRWYEAAAHDLPTQHGELDYRAASCYEEAGDLVTAAHRYQAIEQDPWRIRGQLAAAKLMEHNHEWSEARRLYEGVSRQAVPEAKIAQERLAALDQLAHDETSR